MVYRLCAHLIKSNRPLQGDAVCELGVPDMVFDMEAPSGCKPWHVEYHIKKPFFRGFLGSPGGETVHYLSIYHGLAVSVIDYHDYGEFLIVDDGSSVKCRPISADREGFLLTLFQSVIVPFALGLQGMPSLHASAVYCERGAVLFMGPRRVGKSTLVAALARQGWSYFADDFVPLVLDGRKTVLALPGLPCLKLWPDAIRHVIGSSASSMPIGPKTEKRFVNSVALSANGLPERAPVICSYVLSRQQRSAEGDLPSIRPMPKKDALLGLILAVHRISWHRMRLQERMFSIAECLVAQAPVRYLLYGSGFGRLNAMGRIIHDDILNSGLETSESMSPCFDLATAPRIGCHEKRTKR